MLKRYLYGQAVLSVTAKEQGFLPRFEVERDPDDLLPLLLPTFFAQTWP